MKGLFLTVVLSKYRGRWNNAGALVWMGTSLQFQSLELEAGDPWARVTTGGLFIDVKTPLKRGDATY